MKKSLIFVGGLALLSVCFGGYTFATTFRVTDNAEPISLKIMPKTIVRRHYIETKSWFNSGDPNEHVYVYVFKADSVPTYEKAAFPGEEATYIKDLSDGKKLFYFDIPLSFDSFIVSKVVGSAKTYQTVDISTSDIYNANHNCVYLGDQPANVDTKVNVGSYKYELSLSETSGTITSGGSTQVTIEDSIGTISYQVSPAGSATVSISNNIATISSTTVGSSTITFTDESDSNAVSYSLTVNPAITYRTQYIETKYWFNSGASNEHVYVYAFKNGANPAQENHAWPGEEATYVREISDGKKLFVFNIPDTYDTFIVSKVVDNQGAVYQTENISISTLGSDNCIYLNADYGSSSIPVGHYNVIP